MYIYIRISYNALNCIIIDNFQGECYALIINKNYTTIRKRDMKKIIIDCDNTFGVPNCDVDDGLAIIYALGTNKINLLGITTTFGNSTIDITHPRTKFLLEEIGRDGIPVYRGAAVAEEEATDAAYFLVEMANQYPGEISLLALGSMTNLYAAWKLDPEFFNKIPEISLMGGVVEPLIINGKQLNELNFSCDPLATLIVLTQGKSVSIATGNHCLEAFFSREEFERRLSAATGKHKWLYESIAYWFDRELSVFDNQGIYKWDVFAAAALIEPEWFHSCATEISPTIASLSTGNLLGGGEKVTVRLPKVKDGQAFTQHIYNTYFNY